jgi:hypothetical protein
VAGRGVGVWPGIDALLNPVPVKRDTGKLHLKQTGGAFPLTSFSCDPAPGVYRLAFYGRQPWSVVLPLSHRLPPRRWHERRFHRSARNSAEPVVDCSSLGHPSMQKPQSSATQSSTSNKRQEITARPTYTARECMADGTTSLETESFRMRRALHTLSFCISSTTK